MNCIANAGFSVLVLWRAETISNCRKGDRIENANFQASRRSPAKRKRFADVSRYFAPPPPDSLAGAQLMRQRERVSVKIRIFQEGTCKFYQNVLYLSCDGVITDGNGLIYMRARYYSPDMRRFINADVVVGDISNAGHKVSANIGLGIGLNYDVFHQSESDYKAIRCDSDHAYKRKTIFNILACEHTQHSASISFGLVSVNNSGEVCVGVSFGAYVGIGANVSFNINLTELKKGLKS